jgi:hypothetical protein
MRRIDNLVVLGSFVDVRVGRNVGGKIRPIRTERLSRSPLDSLFRMALQMRRSRRGARDQFRYWWK